ncbi:MAG TPA: hypothetical protein VFW87_03555 [Pirellulales bacterium]|nr:hypothetical protein [Pirellulales bacterium]
MSQKTSRRLAREFARANAPVVEKNLLSGFDNAAGRGLNCTFAISRELTKDGVPYLLSCYGGETFVFSLTQRQAKSFRAIQRTMQCVEGGPILELPPHLEPPIEIERVEFDDADGLPCEQPMTGRLEYTMAGDLARFDGTICVAAEFSLTGRCRVTNYYYPPQGLLPEGEIKFRFEPVANGADERKQGFSGPIVAHVRFLGMQDPKVPRSPVMPLSNTGAVLIELI